MAPPSHDGRFFFYLELTRFDLFLFLSQGHVKGICPDYGKPSPPSDDGGVIRLESLRSPPPANCFGHRGMSMLATQPTQYQIYIQELQLKPAPVHQERMSVHHFSGGRLTGERRLYARGRLFIGVMVYGDPFTFRYWETTKTNPR